VRLFVFAHWKKARATSMSKVALRSVTVLVSPYLKGTVTGPGMGR
jgi:hypothetical protein